jgi:broad specificity phosphatase PhoE
MITAPPYGGGVLSLLLQLPEMGKTLVVIRHPERPSFHNLPIEEWDKAQLTANGIQAAKEFGGALARDATIDSLAIYSWGLKRCAETADAIASGAERAGCEIIDRKEIGLKSPIADRGKYDAALRAGDYNRMLNDWLSPETKQTTMVPVDEYAPEIFGELLDSSTYSQHRTTVVVTHDLHVIPLARHVFGFPIPMPGYLDGLVAKANSKQVQIGYSGMHKSIERSQVVR